MHRIWQVPSRIGVWFPKPVRYQLRYTPLGPARIILGDSR